MLTVSHASKATYQLTIISQPASSLAKQPPKKSCIKFHQVDEFTLRQTRIKHRKSFSPFSYFLPPRARVPLSPPQPPHFTLYVEQEVECGSEICTGSEERTCTRRHTRKNQQVRSIFMQIKQTSVDLNTRIKAAQGRCIRVHENDIFPKIQTTSSVQTVSTGSAPDKLWMFTQENGRKPKRKKGADCNIVGGKKNRKSHMHISLQSHSVRTST